MFDRIMVTLLFFFLFVDNSIVIMRRDGFNPEYFHWEYKEVSTIEL